MRMLMNGRLELQNNSLLIFTLMTLMIRRHSSTTAFLIRQTAPTTNRYDCDTSIRQKTRWTNDNLRPSCLLSSCHSSRSSTARFVRNHQTNGYLNSISTTTSIQRTTTNTNTIITKNGIPPIQSIAGIIFDMDGTLIEPCIDFADMRTRIYEIADQDPFLKNSAPDDRRGDVLELYQTFAPNGRSLAKEVFKDIENKALRDMKLMEGLGDLCNFLDEKGIKRAVLTRNVEASVNVMHDKLWEECGVSQFYPIVSRDTTTTVGYSYSTDVDGSGSILEEQEDQERVIPSKPAPDAIFHICNIWDCTPNSVVMVGDCAADDIVAAHRAECGGKCLLEWNGESLDNDSGGDAGGVELEEQEKLARTPSLVVTSLMELLTVLENSS